MEIGEVHIYIVFFFFQAEDGIRDLVRSRGLGDVYKRQILYSAIGTAFVIVYFLVFVPDKTQRSPTVS